MSALDAGTFVELAAEAGRVTWCRGEWDILLPSPKTLDIKLSMSSLRFSGRAGREAAGYV